MGSTGQRELSDASPERPAPWQRGRTLAERGEDLGGGPASAPDPDARRLERWREDFPDEAALVEALAAGFGAAHGLLRRHRDELLSPGGALAAFAHAPTRIVLRPSKAYADLLSRQVSDPAALDDGLAREEALNPLWRGVRRRPDLAPAAPAELHDLWHGDVPRFTGRPGSPDLHHHATGRLERLLTPHAVEPIDCVRRLDDTDLERQLAFLRVSVVAAAADAPGRAPQAAPPREPTAIATMPRTTTAPKMAAVAPHPQSRMIDRRTTMSPAIAPVLSAPLGPGLTGEEPHRKRRILRR